MNLKYHTECIKAHYLKEIFKKCSGWGQESRSTLGTFRRPTRRRTPKPLTSHWPSFVSLLVQPHLMYKSALSTGGLRSTSDTCIRHSGVVQGRNSESWGFWQEICGVWRNSPAGPEVVHVINWRKKQSSIGLLSFCHDKSQSFVWNNYNNCNCKNCNISML